ncbi:MAG: glycoside hydrolase family 55 protein [Clostridia bacterium]|nr:glycoside hydrolase family 55 protein [Clostridia bacterium]
MKDMYTLFGDGINTDTDAIQSLLDSGRIEIRLPEPTVCYLIDKPLLIHSRQSLVLPRYAVIRLAENSNCRMLENADPENGDTDICISGGIWDYNNLGQLKNPLHYKTEDYPPDYDGSCFFFRKVRNFIFRDLTIKDTVTFACVLDTVSYFTVENIRFDFNLGNPRPVNMDGIHLNGNCHFGHIRNLQGACYDDLVALNADEGSSGPISHIDIRGIYCEGCHSAARLLTVKHAVTDIHISDVHGTFYQYCIGLTKYYAGETTGYYDGIVIEDIFASKSPRYEYLHISAEVARNMYVFPLIWLDGDVAVHALCIRNVYRREMCVPAPTICVWPKSTIDILSVSDCRIENLTDKSLSFLALYGEVRHAEFRNNHIIGGTFYEADSRRLPE